MSARSSSTNGVELPGVMVLELAVLEDDGVDLVRAVAGNKGVRFAIALRWPYNRSISIRISCHELKRVFKRHIALRGVSKNTRKAN